MDFQDYQHSAFRTSSANPDNATITTISEIRLTLAVSAMGLAGEAGELVDGLKKQVGHGVELPRASFVNEAGDVLWYLADLCSQMGVSLQEVAEANVRKLRARYPSGFVQGGGRR